MITDWDDAYANMAYIPDGARYPETWAKAASEFRSNLPHGCTAQLDLSYGSKPRQRFDLFSSAGISRGLLIFVHGGYWMKFGKSDWSHLAAGALARGWSCAMPGYTLAPEARISEIVAEVAEAISFVAKLQGGPIVLAGHSAGGHLVTRMICADTALPQTVLQRILRVVSISGVHDLRPLLRTQLNATLQLTAEEAGAESPVLLQPLTGLPVTCWVGAQERPEFIRQTDLLANIWTGFGLDLTQVHADKRHHFNVIDDLSQPGSELMKSIILR